MIILEIVTLRGQPIGLVAAISKNRVGYSLYNTAKERRKWNIGRAAEIAIGRASINRIDPMESLFDLSEMFRLDMVRFDGTCDERYYTAGDGNRRVFFLTKAVKKMIKKAKKTRW